jgi:hypothetical protein
MLTAPGHRRASSAKVNAKLGHGLPAFLAVVLYLAHQIAAHLAHGDDLSTQASHIVRQHTCGSFLSPEFAIGFPKPVEAPVRAPGRRREFRLALF